MGIVLGARKVLSQLVELDGCDAIARQLGRQFPDVEAAAAGAFGCLDYLFWGQSPKVPGVWIAGGVTQAGQSVTGSGQFLNAALLSVAGEVAEAALRRADAAATDRSGTLGHGAHPDRALAGRHAAQEALERYAVRSWWRCQRQGRIWQQDRLARAATQTGLIPTKARSWLVIEIPAKAGLSVLLVASFDAGDGQFCFGAACRSDPIAAFHSAALELAQAEFGLAIARMKRDSGVPLTRDDDRTLHQAQHIRRADLVDRASDSAAAPPDLPDPHLRLLGSFGDRIHIMEALLSADEAAGLPTSADLY